MKKLFSLVFFFVSFILLQCPLAFGKVFSNAYISFEIPDTWKCMLEQTEWVCRSELSKEAKEAIIILTAKEVGPTDSYSLYEQHLNTPKKIQTRTGTSVDSKISYAPKQYKINDQLWIDGLHFASEVPSYYTRYLAGIRNNKIAILVTFSAHKDYYTKYSQDFIKAVQSLRVIATDNILSTRQGPLNSSGGTLGVNTSKFLPEEPQMADEEYPENSGNKKWLVLAGIILCALGVYIFLKKKIKS